DVGERRIAFQLSEDGPTVYIGQQDVEGDCRRPQRAYFLQPVHPVRCNLDRETLANEMRRNQLAGGRVVVDHQNRAAWPRPCRPRALGWARLCHWDQRRSLRRQTQGESRSLSRGATCPDVATHHPAQLPADRKAEPRPPKLARSRRVGLSEFLEHATELLLA